MNATRLEALLKAADRIGPPGGRDPCFHLEDSGYFCEASHRNEIEYRHPFVSLTDLLRELAGSGWQPIETAPDDGNNVLLYGGFGLLVGFEVPGQGWVSFASKGVYKCNPTHWMPMPEPPTPERRKEEKP